MGREIRKVVPNWEHPKETTYSHIEKKLVEIYIPKMDVSFSEAMSSFINNLSKLPKHKWYEYANEECDAPQSKHYRPDWDEDTMTCYQAYETVSEGTPISPPFETKEELIEWMSTNEDFWGNKWSREAATHFVTTELATSGIMSSGAIKQSHEIVRGY